MKKKKILLIWGIGEIGKYVIDNIVPFIQENYLKVLLYDKNSEMWGQYINGFSVVSEMQLLELDKCELDIIIATNYWESVQEDCMKNGLNQCILTIISSQFNPFLEIEKQVLSKYGFVKSKISQTITDNEGSALPWYTYPAIEFLSKFDYSDKSIFEYGSGFSSKYWAGRCLELFSVESDFKWFEEVKKFNLKNQSIVYENDENRYVESIQRKEKYDVIIIDGMYRDLCAEKAINCIKEDGMIIFDNSDRTCKYEEYKRAYDYLKQLDFLRIDFNGIGTINNYSWTTSVYLSRKFDFKEIDMKSITRPIGGLS